MGLPVYVLPALRTLEASSWTLFCAWLFGRREVVKSVDGTVTLDHWRGVSYLVDYKPANT